MAGFRRAGAAVVAISVDSAQESRALSQQLGLSFPVLSDPERKMIRAWGVADPERPIARPASFVIAAGGKVSYLHRGRTVRDRPSAKTLLAAVRSASQQHSGLCQPTQAVARCDDLTTKEP